MSTNGQKETVTANQLRWQENELIANALLSRSNFLRQYLDPRRDINDECGYPLTESITVYNYQEMYDRNPIAARVVEVLPMETWQTQPEIIEDEDADEETEFEQAWKDVGRGLLQDEDMKITKPQGEKISVPKTPAKPGEEQEEESSGWYQDEEYNPIWEYLRRIDVLSGIGHYGVILLGLDDGQELSQPVQYQEGRKLLFLRCFPEKFCPIAQFETDVRNRRYGRPVTYNLSFADPTLSMGLGAPADTKVVHYTRVIHVADNLGSSEIIGVPRMQPVFNRLMDLSKLYGGSAEMYWRGAFPGLAIETHPQLGGDVTIDTDALKSGMENYMNGLQRYLALMGMTAKSLAPQVVDPNVQIQVQLEAICILLGIPMRVFLGSERGELASSQDSRTWNDRKRDRQRMYLTPRIIIPFINRLIALGILPVPTGYSIKWPDLEKLDPVQESTVLLNRTQAMSAYAAGGVDTLMEPQNYFTREMGFSDEEASEILEATSEHVMEKEEDQVRKMDEGLEEDPRVKQEMEMKLMEAKINQPAGGNPNANPAR